MASKFLRPFRLKNQWHPEPPEEPPETAELVDDTDIAVCLSGTLSLSEDSLASEESNGTGTELPEGRSLEEPNALPLLTKQLREMWANTQDHSVPVRLTFKVTEANIVRDSHSKHVMYTIYLLHSGQYDPSPAFITCQYSDLEQLRKSLRSHYPEEMYDVSFPRKCLHKTTAGTIAKHSRGFEQFLCHVSSLPILRYSPQFLGFFYLSDMQKAQQHTRTGLYNLALPKWTNSWRLQEKLCPKWVSTHRLIVLAGLVVCHQNLDTLADAQAYSEQALTLLQESQEQNMTFLIAFLQAHIQLSWRVGRDKMASEAALLKLKDAGHSTSNAPTLKEILIKETIN